MVPGRIRHVAVFCIDLPRRVRLISRKSNPQPPQILPATTLRVMKYHRSARNSAAFTLIELLVVISIIAVLASMAFPVVTGVMEKARKVRTLAMIKDLQVAIKGYQTEYNRYPVETFQSDSEIRTEEGNTLIPILLGSDNQTTMNGRDITFIDLPMAKNGRGGLVGQSADNYYLVDEWGNPFFVIMDSNGDGKIRNPDTSNDEPTISSGASTDLPNGVAIYSSGPDGAKKTAPSKDDITSWRS